MTITKGHVDGNVVFIDGGSRGNPGPAASAFALSIKGKFVRSQVRFLGTATNNVAEYKALELLAGFLLEQKLSVEPFPDTNEPNVLVLSDSMLLVKQMNKQWATKDGVIGEIQAHIKLLIAQAGARLSYSYIPRRFNVEADAVVNKGLDIAKNNAGSVETGMTLALDRPLSCHPDAWHTENLAPLVDKIF